MELMDLLRLLQPLLLLYPCSIRSEGKHGEAA